MSEALAWALRCARAHTLALVEDIDADLLVAPVPPGERQPSWILGHLLLADTYLLTLLGVQPLAEDFPQLLDRYGPASVRNAAAGFGPKPVLVDRLRAVNAARVARVLALTAEELAHPLPDPVLAEAQATIGHHLQSLVFHEGYHAGQLSAWRKRLGLSPVAWALGPGARGRA
jgi:DinB superfamily